MQAKADAFLEALARGLSATGACKAAGLSRTAAYARRRVDPAFEAAWLDAEERGTDSIIDELRRRAVEGVPRRMYYQGEEIPGSEYLEFSDTLLLALAKSRRPSEFRERYDVNAHVNVTVDYAAEILAARRRAAEGGSAAIVAPLATSAAPAPRAPAPLLTCETVPVGAVADAQGNSWALSLRVPVGSAAYPVLRLTPSGDADAAFDFVADLVASRHALVAGGEGINAMGIVAEVLTPAVLERVGAMVRPQMGGGHRSE